MIIWVILITVVIFYFGNKKDKFNLTDVNINPNISSEDLIVPLSTGLYEQQIPSKNGFKIEISTDAKNINNSFVNVYGVETDCGMGNFTSINRNTYSLANKLLYSGSAVINGNTVHTYASIERSSYMPTFGGFNCNYKDVSNYKREVYNTLTITELGNDKIMIVFKRQKVRKEYAYVGASGLLTPWSLYSLPTASNGNKQGVIDDIKNFFDTDMDYSIDNIILKKTNSVGIKP